MSDEWTKIEMAPSWNGNDDEGNFKLEEGASIQGVYKGKRSEVGKNDGVIYEIETDDGLKGVWESTVIKTKMREVSEGDAVKIVYKGQTKSKSGREYYDYEVYKKAAPMEKIGGGEEEDDIDVDDMDF